MLELRSADVLTPDLQRVGGVTVFLRVTHLAAAFDVPVSSHLFSEVSVKELAAPPNATYREHTPLFGARYQWASVLRDGDAIVPGAPGWGVALDPAAAPAA